MPKLRLSSFQILTLGFFGVVLVATVLFTLPISSREHFSQPFVDALFVACSGISTTGLTPVDIGKFYSLFGQIILLVLMQVGGLGYMVFVVFILSIFRQKISLKTGVLATASISGSTPGNVRKLFLKILIFTLFFEGIGVVILTLYWSRQFPLLTAFYYGVFHSISGFCTAGFSLFTDNLAYLKDSFFVQGVILTLCISGAVGFFVLNDIFEILKQKGRSSAVRYLSLHTKLVLTVVTGLFVIGSMLILFSEWQNLQGGLLNKIMVSVFHTISASTTTGYNTVDLNLMADASLYVLIILMFIGASPGGTGGGIKTSTFGIVMLSVWASLRRKDEVVVFRRRIDPKNVEDAFGIAVLAFILVTFDVLFLSYIEPRNFVKIFFEVVSAFGNVGLSLGITPHLKIFEKLLLSVTMFIGRIGPLAIGYSLVKPSKKVGFKYPEGEIFVG